MNPNKQLKTAILPLVTFTLLWFMLSPVAQAVSPPPDGGYPGGNTAEGDFALNSLTTGDGNTALGHATLFSNTAGNKNTATGASALHDNTTGANNTATGYQALNDNETGNGDTATGSLALTNNIDGIKNTATGGGALASNTSGDNNTATGFAALLANTGGGDNTATGGNALLHNTTGSFNTATGASALQENTTGEDNTATGRSALSNNTTGNENTASGFAALHKNTDGDFNTAIGNNALLNNTTGGSNIALGFRAGLRLTTGSNNIDIGNQGAAGESKTIRIGIQGTQTATFIAGITGTPVVNGMPVAVSPSGQLGLGPVSSKRFKDEIKPMDKASEAILALKPVTFHYKKELDPAGTQQFGLVAEEVEKIDRDLVVRDAEGKAYTVRYDAVNAMLLNEFLKEHQTVQELKKQVAALTAGLQKVSAQLEVSKPAPQTVLNNQ